MVLTSYLWNIQGLTYDEENGSPFKDFFLMSFPITSCLLLRSHADSGSSERQPAPDSSKPSSKISLYTQSPLRTRHLPLPPRHAARRLPHRNSRRLERALGAVVVIVAPQTVHVQRDAGGLGEALQAVRDHLGAEVADLLALQAQVYDAVRAVRQVDDGAAEGLVQRRVGVSEARQARRRAEGAREGVP